MQDKASLAAALQLRFGLNPTEAQITMRLLAQGRVAREQVCGIEVRGHRSIKTGSVGAIVGALRKKLAGYGITIAGINGFGWEICRRDRERVLELLARPKPTNPTRTSPTGATEAAGASPKSGQTQRSPPDGLERRPQWATPSIYR
jgi:hypothetical protein